MLNVDCDAVSIVFLFGGDFCSLMLHEIVNFFKLW